MFQISLVALSAVLFCILPASLVKINKKINANQIISDIVICYAAGMLLGNTRSLWLYSWTGAFIPKNQLQGLSHQTAEIAAYAAVLLAIPLLLMLNNVRSWIKYTGRITLVFFMGVLSTIIITIALGFIYKNNFEDVSIVAGMLAGVYIGGTPNMIAVSKALEAKEELFIVLNATDSLCSIIYFFFLISIGKVILRKILGAFRKQEDSNMNIPSEAMKHEADFPEPKFSIRHIKPIALACTIAIGMLGLSIVPALLFPNAKGELNQAVLMLSLSSLGIAVSFAPKVRELPGVFSFAQYLLLIFGLAAGFLTEFGKLVEVAGTYLTFNALVLLCIVMLHFMLSKIIRGDADSFMISSTACVMGPPFVIQMASTLKNKELLPAGIALSLLGFGLANYAGVMVAWIVQQFG